MSQSTPNAPSTTMITASGKQQVPLRDYLNIRVAPFLKKAVTEALNAEAEYPLQWLGECLIHQSILYEGNPDQTNIRERFRYKFEAPQPEEPAAAPSPRPDADPQEPDPSRGPVAPEADMNEAHSASVEPPPAPQLLREDAPVVNGVGEGGSEPNATEPSKDDDTEMGGTS